MVGARGMTPRKIWPRWHAQAIEEGTHGVGWAPRKREEHIGASPRVREAIRPAINSRLDLAQYKQGFIIHQVDRLARSWEGGSPLGDRRRPHNRLGHGKEGMQPFQQTTWMEQLRVIVGRPDHKRSSRGSADSVGRDEKAVRVRPSTDQRGWGTVRRCGTRRAYEDGAMRA